MKNKTFTQSRFKILKGGKISLILTTLLGSITLSFASPAGESIISGTVEIDRTVSNTTNINQSTSSSIINWNSFNVNTNEIVNFNMPSSNSTSLNRVIGSDSSSIYGQINSNGQVFLINQNGIYFSSTSSVNTAGFTASTLDITNDNFNKSNYIFEGTSESSIINFGTINTDNAYTALLAKEVINEGVIKARLGNIQLASGNKITLDINGNSLVKLTIDEGTLDALVSNKGLIKADGGIVYLTSKALDTVLNGLVNNTGIIESNSIDERDGKIILFAHGGVADIDGSLSASEGFIETSGKELNVASTTEVTADTWLLDPTNLTIEVTGGIDLTGSSVSASAIESALSGSTDVELEADYDITVNEDITWSAATKLTLSAGDEIYVNASIENTNSTTGGVYFKADDTTDSVIFGTNGKVIINNVYQLQWIESALNGVYELGSNIDASATKTDITTWGSEGFDPLGDSSTFFTGSFDGQDYTISDLYINNTSSSYAGLFGYTDTGFTLSNVGLIDSDITGVKYVGGLVGWMKNGVISNSYNTGSVNFYDTSTYAYTGGLVGYMAAGAISNSYNTGSISASTYSTSATLSNVTNSGGLVGKMKNGVITDSYNTGIISSDTTFSRSSAGGLVGWMTAGAISNSYNTGVINSSSANSPSSAGGLVGELENGNITDSYNTGNITSSSSGTYVSSSGGLVAHIGTGSISNSYNIGNVNSFASNDSKSGGLVGSINYGAISNSYNIASVFSSSDSSDSNSGGLAGSIYDVDIIDSYNIGSVSSSTSSSSDSIAGGLVGNMNTGAISNSYNTGSVSISSIHRAYFGGLVGYMNAGAISNSYNTGTISSSPSPSSYSGGLVGYTYSGTVTNSFWDTETSKQSTSSGGGTEKTTEEMQNIDTYLDALWDVEYLDNYDYLTTPYLSNEGTSTWLIGKISPVIVSTSTQRSTSSKVVNNITRQENTNKNIQKPFQNSSNLGATLALISSDFSATFDSGLSFSAEVASPSQSQTQTKSEDEDNK